MPHCVRAKASERLARRAPLDGEIASRMLVSHPQCLLCLFTRRGMVPFTLTLVYPRDGWGKLGLQWNSNVLCSASPQQGVSFCVCLMFGHDEHVGACPEADEPLSHSEGLCEPLP